MFCLDDASAVRSIGETILIKSEVCACVCMCASERACTVVHLCTQWMAVVPSSMHCLRVKMNSGPFCERNRNNEAEISMMRTYAFRCHTVSVAS